MGKHTSAGGRDAFRSRWGFKLACIGSAVGMGNIWMFPSRVSAYGAVFLRCMVTAMPMMSLCYPMIIQFQAMGQAKESLLCSLLRKGVLDIPLLFFMDRLLPLYGCMWVQPIVDTVSLVAALLFYRSLRRKLAANRLA